MSRPIENCRESSASLKVTCYLAAAMRPFTVHSAATDVVVIVFLQAEESNDVGTAAVNDIHFPPLEVTEVTGGHMRPVVKLKKMHSTRLLLFSLCFVCGWSIVGHTDCATPGCSAHLRFTGLEPAVGLRPALCTAGHTSSITCLFLRSFYTGTKLYCLVIKAHSCEQLT